MDEVKRFVGIDVAKAALDVFIGSDAVAFSVTNDEVGIRELLGQLKPTDFVILEAVWRRPSPALWRPLGSRLR
jgi:transposase